MGLYMIFQALNLHFNGTGSYNWVRKFCESWMKW